MGANRWVWLMREGVYWRGSRYRPVTCQTENPMWGQRGQPGGLGPVFQRRRVALATLLVSQLFSFLGMCLISYFERGQ